ncbi:unnamed protein product [Closterium sp. Yama58-4]|nr:unnamed protein product [Closterium sp. Yama58-4]
MGLGVAGSLQKEICSDETRRGTCQFGSVRLSELFALGPAATRREQREHDSDLAQPDALSKKRRIIENLNFPPTHAAFDSTAPAAPPAHPFALSATAAAAAESAPTQIDFFKAREDTDALPGAEETSDGPSLSDLGEDLLLKILQEGQPTAWDLCRYACVNSTWRKLCYSRVFWTKLRIGPGSMHAGVEQLAPRCAQLTDLFIDDPRCELHVLHPIIVSCGESLRHVVIDCDQDSTSRNEASICSILWIISLYCKQVQSIELTSAGVETSFGALETRCMWYLTSGFRNVRHFASLSRNSVTKQAIYLMVIAWRDLTCLRIHNGGLEVDDLFALRKCAGLRLLELFGGSIQTPGALANSCPFAAASGATVFHRELEVLVLTDVDFDAGAIATIALHCPKLRKIIVKGVCCHACGSKVARGGPEGEKAAEAASACAKQKVALLRQILSLADRLEVLMQ